MSNKRYTANEKSKAKLTLKMLKSYISGSFDTRNLISELAEIDREGIDALEEYASDIENILAPYNEPSKKRTMMLMLPRMRKTTSGEFDPRRNRYVHQRNTGHIAEKMAKGIGLNKEITKIGAQIHDIGHTTGGHDGEYYISQVLKNYGAGFVCHNIETVRQLTLRHKVHDKIMDKIKEEHPKLSKVKLNRIKNSLWYLDDIVACHNGEHTQKEILVNIKKTEKEFWDDLVKCCVIPGYDRKMVPATAEAAIVKFADPTEYAPNDTIDGLIEGIILDLDEEYEKIYEKIGITKEQLHKYINEKNYYKIPQKMWKFMEKDVIENSDNNCIRISENAGEALYGLRAKNYSAVVGKTTTKFDQEIYERCINSLMNTFFSMYVEEKNDNKDLELISKDETKKKELLAKYEGKYQEEFAKYICNTTPEEYEFIKRVVDLSERETIKQETIKAIELLKSGKDLEDNKYMKYQNNRINKHKKMLEAYYQEGSVALKEKELNAYIDQVAKRVRENGEPNYFDRDIKIAIRIAGEYMMQLDDERFINLIKKAGLINKDEEAKLYKKYIDMTQEELNGDDTSACLDEIRKNQEEEQR